MKPLALVFVVACGSQVSAPPPRAEPIPSVASTQPAVVDPPAAPRFRVVRDTVHATTQMLARIGYREPATTALLASDPAAVCYVATGLSPDTGAKCSARVEGANATVEVDFEDDTMQSRARTHVAMRGTITVDQAHVIVRASFTGQEQFEFRSPCEKNDGCERCDPLVKTPGCKLACFCPFKDAGNAEIETSYGP